MQTEVEIMNPYASYPYKISNYTCKGKIIISEKGSGFLGQARLGS
jgi:hypothetical protein